MWWIAATVIGTNMYIMFDQCTSSRDLKHFHNTLQQIVPQVNSAKADKVVTQLQIKLWCRECGLPVGQHYEVATSAHYHGSLTCPDEYV